MFSWRRYACIYLNCICCCTKLLYFCCSVSCFVFSQFSCNPFLRAVKISFQSWWFRRRSIAASGQAGCCRSEAHLFIWQLCLLKCLLLKELELCPASGWYFRLRTEIWLGGHFYYLVKQVSLMPNILCSGRFNLFRFLAVGYTTQDILKRIRGDSKNRFFFLRIWGQNSIFLTALLILLTLQALGNCVRPFFFPVWPETDWFNKYI